MVKVVATSFALWISIYDVHTHRIPDQVLIVFAIPLILSAHITSWRTTLLSILIAFIIVLLLGIGGGDFKLAALLLATQGALVFTLVFLTVFIGALAVALCYALLRGKMMEQIAFAPTLLAPFLYCYLAI